MRADQIAHPENYSKACTACRQDKPLTEYSINRAQKDGRHPRCKACNKIALLANEQNRLERLRQGRPPQKFGKYCGVCCGLAHQRPVDGCPGCGLPFEAETPPSIDAAAERRDYGRVCW